MDPLAEKFPRWSAYVYTFNNPVRLVDPDGRQPSESNNGRVFVGVETSGLGHMYTVVQKREGSNTVYTYGRYDGGSAGSGKFSPAGDGVLLKYEGAKANEYIQTRTAAEGGALFEIVGADPNQVAGFHEQQLSSSSQPSERHPQDGKVVDTYTIVGNNCVTVTNEALTAGGAGHALQTTVVDPNGPRVITVTPQTPAGASAVLNKKSTTDQDGVRRVDAGIVNTSKKDEKDD